MKKRISVFGSARPRPGEAAYEEALKLGSKLGAAGCSVLTGGYIGTMEAVSRGVAESGGFVIGVTCDEIEKWRPGGANTWVKEEVRTSRAIDRLCILVEDCDAAVALPGGIGTMTEISLMWSMMSIRALPERSLILVGPGWKDVFMELLDAQDKYIKEDHRGLLSFAPGVEKAFDLLQ